MRDATREVPLSWFGKTLWKYTPFYAEMMLLAVCIRLIGLIEPFIFQVVIDRILPFEREASLIVVVLIFIAVSLFQALFEILAELLGLITANRVTRDLGGRLFDHLFKLPYAHFRRWPIGETIARIGETDTIRGFIVGASTGLLLDVVFAGIYIAALVMLSGSLTMIVLVALPLQAAIYLSFGPWLRRRIQAEFDAGAAHQSLIVDNMAGVAAIKAMSAERPMLRKLDATLDRALATGHRVSVLQIASDKLNFIVERGVTIAIIFFGAQLVFDGHMTLGELIAFNLLAEKVTGPIANFSGLWETWQNVRISRRRLGDILGETQEGFDARPRLPAGTRGHLSFREVSFSYDGETPVLDRLDFDAPAGTLSLIVGPSGCGKSTFGRLASGIETPEHGMVCLDGLNISEFDPHDVRQQVAYVPQEPYLFSGTIRDNLALGAPDAHSHEMDHALKVAAADAFVRRLPKGLDTPVGERGAALSGGQRQRIAIARAILSRPRVLILDEPTSALDDAAQRAMVRQLSALKGEMTLVVITHRPEILEDADQVVELGAIS